jgi:hypothetical protein
MKSIFISKPLDLLNEPYSGPDNEIHVFTQFFIHRQNFRNEELKFCLASNLSNPHLTKVHLLNERIYSNQELGLSDEGAAALSGRLVQYDTGGKRLTPQIVLQYIRERGIRGYLIFTNSDIFFDETIRNLRATTLNQEKKFLALLRYEYKGANSMPFMMMSAVKRQAKNACPLFGPRFDSQDTWIFHSNFSPKEYQEKAFGYEFGKPGIDNKIVYLMRVLGFEPINDPQTVRTYHYQRSITRDYSAKDVLPKPWAAITPVGVDPLSIPPSLGINIMDVFKATNGFQSCMFNDSAILYKYISDKLAVKAPFVIPRIAGIENNVAIFTRIKKETGRPDFDPYFQQILPAMKNNAGILLTSPNSLLSYSDMYLKAFENCDVFTGWDVQGEVYPHIAQSHDHLKSQLVAANKVMLWAFALDAFHYVYDDTCWTKALRGKRILVISPFVDSIREKVGIREKLYDGVDLFPDCTFVFAKPPQTQAAERSEDFLVELEKFKTELNNLRDQYDVALVSCGGYGNLVCNYIFESHRKSAIYVGGVLQMYFGVLGGRWFKERPDILRLFMNEHWSRPKESERPAGHGQIENGCYW